MDIEQLLKENDLIVDDVRWYLSSRLSRKILAYRDNEHELTRLIWSGALEDELYRMVERYLEDLKADIERGYKDRAKLREIFREMTAARARRYSAGEL